MTEVLEIKKEKFVEILFVILLITLGSYNIYLASSTSFLGEDEAGYVHTGELFSKGEYRTFTQTGKPELFSPFIPLVYSVTFIIFGASLSIAKAIIAIFSLLTLLLVYLIGKRINMYFGMFAVSVMMLMTTFFHYSMLSYVDVPIAFFSALFIYLVGTMESKKVAVLLGAVLGLAYLTKVSGFFLIMILILYASYLFLVKRDNRRFRLSLIAIIVSVLFLVPYIIRNIAIFNYPFFIVLDVLLPPMVYGTPGWQGPGASGTTPLLSFNYFINTFGWIPMILGVFGIVYILLNIRNEKSSTILSMLAFSTFLVMFLVLYSLGKTIAESRYLMIVFPQLAIIGGYFLYKLKDRNKYFVLLLVPLICLGVYFSAMTTIGTAQSNRFPSDYIEALKWVEANSLEDALVFTTYGGSVRNYAHRDNIWTEVVEFDKIMTTNDGKYVHDILTKYNVSYVVIWNGVIAKNYFIPHANLAGVFTFNFLNVVVEDTDDFNIVYQNQNSIVLEVL